MTDSDTDTVRSPAVEALFDRTEDPMPEQLVSRVRQVSTQLFGAPAADTLAPGSRLGRFEVVGELGAGGQAVVYEARHVELGRRVALKVPHPEQRALLMREARLSVRLEHRHVVRIEDVRDEEGSAYLVMPLCRGGSVATELAQHPDGLPLDRVIAIARDVLEALAFVHRRGVVHRDVKPSNILLDSEGRALLGDVGIGTLTISPEAFTATTATTAETVTGIGVAGTPAYMAPEQAVVGAALDGRADLYSFGKLLYVMLTGKHPSTVLPPSRCRSELDPRWDELVFCLLEDSPDRRPEDAGAVRAMLGAVTERASLPSSKLAPAGRALRRGRLALILLTPVLLGAIVAHLLAEDSMSELPIAIGPPGLVLWAGIGVLGWLSPRLRATAGAMSAGNLSVLFAVSALSTAWFGFEYHQEDLDGVTFAAANALIALGTTALAAVLIRRLRGSA